MMRFGSPVFPRIQVVKMMIAVLMAMIIGDSKNTLVMGQWVGCFEGQLTTGESFTSCVWGVNLSPLQLSYGSEIITLGTDSYILSVCTSSVFSASTCGCILWVNPLLVPSDVPGIGLDFILATYFDKDEVCNSCTLGSIASDSYTLTSYDCSNRLPLSDSCAVFSSDAGCSSSVIATPTNPTFANPTDFPINAPNPTRSPINAPNPARSPINAPNPARSPINAPNPARFPINPPILSPTRFPINPPNPTDFPTKPPTPNPTDSPTNQPTLNPTDSPTKSPTSNPTDSPTKSPTPKPTRAPVQPSAVTTAGQPNELPSSSDAAAVHRSMAVVGMFLATMLMAPEIFLC
jgi:hypothetical protein